MNSPPPVSTPQYLPSRRGGEELRIEALSNQCDERGIRLTPARRRVLQLLATATGPLKAYAILEAVRKESPNTAPTAVYRVLEFLQRNGLAIKLNSINAFLLRPSGPAWSCTFLVCEKCGSVDTIHAPMLPEAFLADVDSGRFAPTSQTLEISGTCSVCRSAQAQNDCSTS